MTLLPAEHTWLLSPIQAQEQLKAMAISISQRLLSLTVWLETVDAMCTLVSPVKRSAINSAMQIET